MLFRIVTSQNVMLMHEGDATKSESGLTQPQSDQRSSCIFNITNPQSANGCLPFQTSDSQYIIFVLFLGKK